MRTRHPNRHSRRDHIIVLFSLAALQKSAKTILEYQFHSRFLRMSANRFRYQRGAVEEVVEETKQNEHHRVRVLLEPREQDLHVRPSVGFSHLLGEGVQRGERRRRGQLHVFAVSEVAARDAETLLVVLGVTRNRVDDRQ